MNVNLFMLRQKILRQFIFIAGILLSVYSFSHNACALNRPDQQSAGSLMAQATNTVERYIAINFDTRYSSHSRLIKDSLSARGDKTIAITDNEDEEDKGDVFKKQVTVSDYFTSFYTLVPGNTSCSVRAQSSRPQHFSYCSSYRQRYIRFRAIRI